MVQNFEYGIDEAKAAGLIENYYYTDANADPNKQIADIEDLLTKGCDVLIISADDRGCGGSRRQEGHGSRRAGHHARPRRQEPGEPRLLH